MKKKNIYLIACMVSAVTSINSFAAVLVSGPGDSISISSTTTNVAVNAYLASLDAAPRSFTMTGGSVDVTSTHLGSAARGVYTDSTTGGAVVNISGGTMTITDSGDKDAALIRMNDHEDSLTISGGTFNLTESGLGGAYGIRVIRDVPVNISGGTFNFSQDDSSVGNIFTGGGAAETTINLSGGLFNNLDQFDTHVSLSDKAIMNFSVLSLTDTGLTVDSGTGLITEKTGTIAGTLADGSAFSFVFENLEDSSMTVTVGDLKAALVTPSELAISHDSGAGSATGTVDAVHTSSTNMDVTITISDQSHSGAFTVLSATPQTLTNETTELAFEFDNTVANLTFGETATGLVTIVWAETGGGASGTNFMPISATVPNPPVYVWNGSSDTDWTIDANWEGELGQAVDPVFDNTAIIKMAGTANLDQYIRGASTVKSFQFMSSNTGNYALRLVALNGADRDLTFSADSGNATLTIDALASGDKTFGADLLGALSPGEVVLLSDLDITHNGSGDLIFAAEIRGDGDLNIAGTGATVLSGMKTFTIGADGINNDITGSGAVNFDGNFSFILTSAGTTVGDSWTIVDVDNLTETFGSTFSVTNFSDAGNDEWTLDIDGTSAYQFSEITGVLTVIPPAGYQGWIEGFGLSGADLLPETDVEPDGLDNLMEYALGGNPTIDDAADVAPKTYTADDGGTDYFYHVSDQRTDDTSLTFTLGATDNLVHSPADTNDVAFVGESMVSNNYKTVTNRTEATPSAKFIKLEVQQD